MTKKKLKPHSYCTKQGFHDWEVVCVNGTLPTQELDLWCATCGASGDGEVTNIDYEPEDDD